MPDYAVRGWGFNPSLEQVIHQIKLMRIILKNFIHAIDVTQHWLYNLIENNFHLRGGNHVRIYRRC